MSVEKRSGKIVNAQGERVEIVLEFHMESYSRVRGCEYRVRDILITPPRKRKPLYLSSVIRDRYEYRELPYDKRDEYVKAEFLKHVTEEQIMAEAQKLYESFAPTEENITYHVY